MVSVLLVTGPIGVGKSAVLLEADCLLNRIKPPYCHATVELEDVARCWPEGIESSRGEFVYGNLAALWSNFAAAGASRLLLSALIERRSEVERVERAVPGAVVTVVRLQAPLPVVEHRIRLRVHLHGPDMVDSELAGARWWTHHFEREQPEDYLIETDETPIGEIARDLLQVAGWIV